GNKRFEASVQSDSAAHRHRSRSLDRFGQYLEWRGRHKLQKSKGLVDLSASAEPKYRERGHFRTNVQGRPGEVQAVARPVRGGRQDGWCRILKCRVGNLNGWCRRS